MLCSMRYGADGLIDCSANSLEKRGAEKLFHKGIYKKCRESVRWNQPSWRGLQKRGWNAEAGVQRVHEDFECHEMQQLTRGTGLKRCPQFNCPGAGQSSLLHRQL